MVPFDVKRNHYLGIKRLDMYGQTVHAEQVASVRNMQLVRFRHKGLRQLHEEGSAKGVPSAMIDKLRKLLFALETAETLDQLRRFPGWKLHPLKGEPERIMEPHCYRKLAADFPLRRTDEHRQRH